MCSNICILSINVISSINKRYQTISKNKNVFSGLTLNPNNKHTKNTNTPNYSILLWIQSL